MLGDAPLRHLPDLFGGVHRVVVSVPELAHYDPASYGADTVFVGPAFVADRGAAPVWPDGSGPRVFAYLAPHAP